MSGYYIGVDGKARKVRGCYIGIDGKARKIKKGYIGVNGVARLCWSDVNPVFADNTWEEIVAACQSGSVPSSWAVGDQKPITIDGHEYLIDIIGKNHDEYSDGSGKAPLTLQFHETYVVGYGMHNQSVNSCGWESSEMRTSRLPGILSLMPQIVRTSIKEVRKLTSAGGNSSTIVTTADKLFLLSEVEVFGTTANSYSGEGTQYEYYKTRDKIKCEINSGVYKGNAEPWWERSPAKSSTFFCRVTTAGVAATGSAASGSYPAPAFCF